jgi:hypothetical protein
MLHDELMDPVKIVEARTALICARLHLRGGKRRLQQGYSAAGIAALYDAVLFGMRYYIVKHTGCAPFVTDTDLWDAAGLFNALVQAGVFDDHLSFNRFSLIVERALWQPSFSFDADFTLAEVERMLKKLGVMPFDESTLPGKTLIMH